jgi:ubiquitin-protein ligase
VERCKIKVALKNDMYNELEGTIAGPPDTPYAGGTFKLEIKINQHIKSKHSVNIVKELLNYLAE